MIIFRKGGKEKDRWRGWEGEKGKGRKKRDERESERERETRGGKMECTCGWTDSGKSGAVEFAEKTRTAEYQNRLENRLERE